MKGATHSCRLLQSIGRLENIEIEFSACTELKLMLIGVASEVVGLVLVDVYAQRLSGLIDKFVCHFILVVDMVSLG